MCVDKTIMARRPGDAIAGIADSGSAWRDVAIEGR
jgi:hypothetical protein